MPALSDGTILWSTVHYGLSHPQQFWFHSWQTPVKGKWMQGFKNKNKNKKNFTNLSTYTAQTHPRMCTIHQDHKLQTLNISLLQILLGISCLAPSAASLFSCQGLLYLTVFKHKGCFVFPSVTANSTHRRSWHAFFFFFFDTATMLLWVPTNDNFNLSSSPNFPRSLKLPTTLRRDKSQICKC